MEAVWRCLVGDEPAVADGFASSLKALAADASALDAGALVAHLALLDRAVAAQCFEAQ